MLSSPLELAASFSCAMALARKAALWALLELQALLEIRFPVGDAPGDISHFELVDSLFVCFHLSTR